MRTNIHLADDLRVWGPAVEEAHGAVLAVHGRAQSPEFMMEQAARLDLQDWRFYAPLAAGNTWYPLPFLEPLAANEPDLGMALDSIDVRLDSIEDQGFDPGKIVLMGFSQGACLLAHHVLTRPRTIGGLVLFTGGFIGSGLLKAQPRSLFAMPVVVRSVEHDPFVPVHRIHATVAQLEAAGAQVDAFIAGGCEHSISDEAIDRARTLLLTLSRDGARTTQ